MWIYYFSLFNCEDMAGISRANTRGRMKKGSALRVLYARCPAYAGNGRKKRRRKPHVKIPKHNVTVLFTATSVNMRDYEFLGSEI